MSASLQSRVQYAGSFESYARFRAIQGRKANIAERYLAVDAAHPAGIRGDAPCDELELIGGLSVRSVDSRLELVAQLPQHDQPSGSCTAEEISVGYRLPPHRHPRPPWC